MMQTKAYDTGTVFLFVVHLDATKMIPDPSLPAPVDGRPDTRPLAPDPEWVMRFEWGKDAPNGQTQTQFLANCKLEAERLGALELQRRQPPAEISLPI